MPSSIFAKMCRLRALVAIGLVVGIPTFTRSALGQSTEELTAGRRLFGEALYDEEHGKFAAALEKYKRVQRIRDTVAVRFRLGATYEGLGKLTAALSAYKAAIALGTSAGTDADIVRAAESRAEVLTAKIAHLTLRISGQTETNTTIAVDGEEIKSGVLSDVAIDPGRHVVTATGDGIQPFRAELTLSEGARAEIPIALVRSASPPPMAIASHGNQSPVKTAGMITGIVGGSLVVTGIVFFALRSHAIAELENGCPGGVCPSDREQYFRDLHDRAEVQGPIGTAFVATGSAAIATGLVLFALSPNEAKKSLRLVPTPASRGAGATLMGSF